MTLDTYLDRPGAMNLTALSAALGVSKARLSQIRSSNVWPPRLALKAEAVTEGLMDAGRLCPIIAEARKTAA